jgi:hypothetical protein
MDKCREITARVMAGAGGIYFAARKESHADPSQAPAGLACYLKRRRFEKIRSGKNDLLS